MCVAGDAGLRQGGVPPGSRQADWFSAYAYPLTDNVFVTWSEDPDKWVPLNHSCDPNS